MVRFKLLKTNCFTWKKANKRKSSLYFLTFTQMNLKLTLSNSNVASDVLTLISDEFLARSDNRMANISPIVSLLFLFLIVWLRWTQLVEFLLSSAYKYTVFVIPWLIRDEDDVFPVKICCFLVFGWKVKSFMVSELFDKRLIADPFTNTPFSASGALKGSESLGSSGKHSRYGKQLNYSSSFPVSALQVVNLRLIDDNYRYWHAQALLAIGAHDLEKYLTGLISCPTLFLLVKSNNGLGKVKVPNSMFSV